MLAIPLAEFFNTIVLLGAIQGFIVSTLLFLSKKNRQSNRLLSALIFLIALASFNLYGNYKDWFHSDILRFIVNFLPLVVVMPMGPLVYFYVQSTLDPNFCIGKKEKRHFLPIIIDFVPPLVAAVFVIGVLLHLLQNKPAPWGIFIDTYNVYADIPRWASMSLYVWLSAKYLQAYKRKNSAGLNGHTVHFNWLQQFIRLFIVFQVIWFFYLVPYVIPKYTDVMLNTFEWYPIYIPMAILIYWLGIKGYIISQQQIIIEKKTTANNVLSAATIKQVSETLAHSMESGKLYLNPNLNLATLSEYTGIAQKTISAVLNQHLEKSFNEFVNGYRVNAFKQKILQPDLSHLTIAGVASECGFNSQATFQRTFKEVTGQSPSEFRKLSV